MTIRQKLEALGLFTGDHDADVHRALDEVARLRDEAEHPLMTMDLAAKTATIGTPEARALLREVAGQPPEK